MSHLEVHPAVVDQHTALYNKRHPAKIKAHRDGKRSKNEKVNDEYDRIQRTKKRIRHELSPLLVRQDDAWRWIRAAVGRVVDARVEVLRPFLDAMVSNARMGMFERAKFVDIGCGMGSSCAYFALSRRIQCIGIERNVHHAVRSAQLWQTLQHSLRHYRGEYMSEEDLVATYGLVHFVIGDERTWLRRLDLTHVTHFFFNNALYSVTEQREVVASLLANPTLNRLKAKLVTLMPIDRNVHVSKKNARRTRSTHSPCTEFDFEMSAWFMAPEHSLCWHDKEFSCMIYSFWDSRVDSYRQQLPSTASHLVNAYANALVMPAEDSTVCSDNDIKSRLCEAYKSVKRGELLLPRVRLVDFGAPRNIGVVAEYYIPPNVLVLEYEGDLVTETEGKGREVHYDADGRGCFLYFFTLGRKRWCVDATLQTHHTARYINHSAKNADLRAYAVRCDDDWNARILFMSTRGILSGEELLFDYGDNRAHVKRSFPFLKE